MKPTERAFIYTALAALIGVNAVLLLSYSTSPGAIAAPIPAPADDLGPAASLKLTGDDGDLVLKSAKGRLSFGDGAARQTWTVGFVDTGRILNPLMSGATLVDERTALGKELEAQDQDYREKLDAMYASLQDAKRETPEGQQAFEEGQRMYQEYQAWAQTARERRNQLDVQHLEKCYRELVSAVDVVAERKGVDIVYRYIAPDKEFKAADAEGALTEIRLRAAVRCPKDLDITTDVLEELSLSTEEPVDPQP